MFILPVQTHGDMSKDVRSGIKKIVGMADWVQPESTHSQAFFTDTPVNVTDSVGGSSEG